MLYYNYHVPVWFTLDSLIIFPFTLYSMSFGFTAFRLLSLQSRLQRSTRYFFSFQAVVQQTASQFLCTRSDFQKKLLKYWPLQHYLDYGVLLKLQQYKPNSQKPSLRRGSLQSLEGSAITAGYVDVASRTCCVVFDAIKTALSIPVVVRSSGVALAGGEGRMLSKPASTVHSCGNELLASFDPCEFAHNAGGKMDKPASDRLGRRS